MRFDVTKVEEKLVRLLNLVRCLTDHNYNFGDTLKINRLFTYLLFVRETV